MKRIAVFSLLLACPSLLTAQSSTVKDYIQMGEALYKQGLYEKALDYFQQAVRTDPKNAQAYNDVGAADMKLERYPEALAAYRQSLQLDPNDPTILNLVNYLTKKSGASGPASPADAGSVPLSPKHQWEDGLNPIDHSRVWTRFAFGYDYSTQGDLASSAAALNGEIAQQGWAGSGTAGTDGILFGGEVGFSIDPYNGFAFGVWHIDASQYLANVDEQPGVTGGNYEYAYFQPSTWAYTADYYFFLPDAQGRFFLSAGVGLYDADVHVGESSSQSGTVNDLVGDLNGQNVGFQLGIGREWALAPDIGFSLLAHGRIARVSDLSGDLVNNSGPAGTYGLATSSQGIVDVAPAQQIGASYKNTYTTVDFTGFDLMFAMVFYSY